MGIPILIDIAVGETLTPVANGEFATIPLAAAAAVTAAARDAGVAALRLLDSFGAQRVIDPSVVGAYLAGRIGDIGYLVDLPTTGNAPYNAARRILSFDRATDGRVGVVLRPGIDDEVSRATAPDPATDEPARRWSEFAEILGRLWESFPRAALIGDQERALVVEEALIAPIDYDGRFYRVAGPLDGPSSVQGRPVVVAVYPDVLGWADVALFADAVVVDRAHSAAADRALTEALEQVSRGRAEIALLGGTTVTVTDEADARRQATEFADWVERDRLDGLALAPTGGVSGVVAALTSLVPLLSAPTGSTLRAALGLRATTEAAV